ncbi:hypothetical protein JHK87_010385 [Glycine soja]|nr:hypothetical protein JHK87_010385 [Glycine soja]
MSSEAVAASCCCWFWKTTLMARKLDFGTCDAKFAIIDKDETIQAEAKREYPFYLVEVFVSLVLERVENHDWVCPWKETLFSLLQDIPLHLRKHVVSISIDGTSIGYDPEVLNFEYVDEAKATTEEAAQKRAMETLNSSEKTHFWEVLLRDKYQEHKKEFNALGKRKRNRKSVIDLKYY